MPPMVMSQSDLTCYHQVIGKSCIESNECFLQFACEHITVHLGQHCTSKNENRFLTAARSFFGSLATALSNLHTQLKS